MSLYRLARLAARFLVPAAGLWLLLGLATAPALEAAPRLKPSPIIWGTGHTPVCVEGDGEPIILAAIDRTTGRSLSTGFMDITTNQTGSKIEQLGGHPVGYTYKPQQAGPDTITVQVNAPGYQSASKDYPVQVVHCKWTLQIEYDGKYATVPPSLWEAFEGMWVDTPGSDPSDAIPLTVDSQGVVSGSGQVWFTAGIHGAAPDIDCSMPNVIGQHIPVTVSGNVKRDIMFLSASFGSQSMSGGGLITCNVAGQAMEVGNVPLNGDSSVLASLGLSTFTVPKAGGSASPAPPVRTVGVFWNTQKIKGEGHVTIVVHQIQSSQ